jgi:hypothetical protein
MSFGGGPLEVGTEEEAEKLTSQNEMDSANGNDYTTPCNFQFMSEDSSLLDVKCAYSRSRNLFQNLGHLRLPI